MIIRIYESLVSKPYTKFTGMTDRQRDMMEPLLPKPAARGRPRSNDRMVLNGIICVPVSRCRWSEMPKTCGDGSAANPRPRRWQEFGIWKKILGRAIKSAHRQGKINLEKTSVDSSPIPQKGGDVIGFDGFESQARNYMLQQTVPACQHQL